MRQLLVKFLATTCCFLLLGCGETKETVSEKSQIVFSQSAININTASIAELEKLPNIGEKLAAKIIEHREKFGNFRKPEHLMLVRGVSDRRFREMRNLIRTEN